MALKHNPTENGLSPITLKILSSCKQSNKKIHHIQRMDHCRLERELLEGTLQKRHSTAAIYGHKC